MSFVCPSGFREHHPDRCREPVTLRSTEAHGHLHIERAGRCERRTQRLLVIEPAHYEGEATEDVLPPTPLGRMGRRMQEIADMPPEQRPLDFYVALAEVAR